jgi:hypothetical protein
VTTIPYPTKKRAIGALLAAPLLPVGVLFVLDAVDRAVHFGAPAIVGAAMLAIYTLIVVEFFSLTLGGITLAALWRRVPLNVLLCSLIGGVVAVLPFLIFGLFSAAQEPMNYDAWVDGQATVVNGVKTSYGRWQDFLALLEIFGLGVLGGGFFWWRCRPTRAQEAA